MLATLFAAGIIGGENVDVPAGLGPINVSAERTVAFPIIQGKTNVGSGIPLGAPSWAQPFDPGDHLAYAGDFSALLDTDEHIASIVSITLSATGAALGVLIDDDPSYAPVIDEDGRKKLKVFFAVNDEFQADAQFDSSGAQIGVAFRVLTDATPPNRFERTGVLAVRQL